MAIGVLLPGGASRRRARARPATLLLRSRLVGALAGWALGYALTGALGMVEIKNPMIDATRLPLVYSFLHYLVAAAVALGSSLVAGYFPARKASRAYPVDIIRGAT